MVDSGTLVIYRDVDDGVVEYGAVEYGGVDGVVEYGAGDDSAEYLCCRVYCAVYEPSRGKTNNVVFEQVRHKPACTSTEDS